GPSLRGLFELGIFERLGWIAGDGIKSPRLLAGIGVVGSKVAARRELGAAVSDEDLALDDAGRSGDAVVFIGIRGLNDPLGLSCIGVQGNQTAIQRAYIDLALIKRDATIDRATAQPRTVHARDVGIVAPLFLAGAGI